MDRPARRTTGRLPERPSAGATASCRPTAWPRRSALVSGGPAAPETRLRICSRGAASIWPTPLSGPTTRRGRPALRCGSWVPLSRARLGPFDGRVDAPRSRLAMTRSRTRRARSLTMFSRTRPTAARWASTARPLHPLRARDQQRADVLRAAPRDSAPTVATCSARRGGHRLRRSATRRCTLYTGSAWSIGPQDPTDVGHEGLVRGPSAARHRPEREARLHSSTRARPAPGQGRPAALRSVPPRVPRRPLVPEWGLGRPRPCRHQRFLKEQPK